MLSPLRRWTASFVDAVRPGLQSNVLFIHPPKCGGNAVHAALGRHYPKSARTKLASRASKVAADQLGVDLHAYRRGLLRYELERGGSGRLVSGHYPIDADLVRDHGGHWTLVTLLRDPVERFISHYFYNLHAGGPFTVSEPLERFVDTPRARSWGRIFVRQFSGGRPDDAWPGEEAAVEAAQRTLRGFDVVGTLEAAEAFRAACAEALGTRVQLRRKNVGPVAPRERAAAVDAALRARITELCAPDLALHRALGLSGPT